SGTPADAQALFSTLACCPSCVSRRVFFFQAEDGIRDKLVTGVQTCALPIYRDIRLDLGLAQDQLVEASELCRLRRAGEVDRDQRSEERRVGKECRGRWALHD